jgi:hypothetical protein
VEPAREPVARSSFDAWSRLIVPESCAILRYARLFLPIWLGAEQSAPIDGDLFGFERSKC